MRVVLARLAWAGLLVALLAAVTCALSGFGTRWGWWHFRTGLTMLRYGAMAALAGGVLAGGAGLIARRWGVAAVGLLVAAVAFGVPFSWARTAQRVPPIHDITTDVKDPPRFDAILALRTGASNPPEYPGAEVAAQQARAYPDIGPIRLEIPTQEAFRLSVDTARNLGWEVVATNRDAGRIEAIDRTFWFGFTDDIVIRIRPEGNGSRVDIRSKSRVGRSDVGTNARRIRTFTARLREAAQDRGTAAS